MGGERAFAKAEVVSITVTGSKEAPSTGAGSLTTENGFVLDYDVVVNGADSYIKAKITYPEWVGNTPGTTVSGNLNAFIGNVAIGTAGMITFTRTKGTEATGEATVKIAGAVVDGKNITLGEVSGSELTASYVKVKYEGTDVAKYVAGETKELSSSGAAIALSFSTTAADATINGAVKYTVTGCASEVTTPTAVTATSGAITSLTGAAVVPNGDGYVVVTLTGLDQLVQAYSIVTSGELDIKDKGDAANTSGKIEITGAPAAAIPEGTKAAIQATIDNLNSNYAYKVTVTLEDGTKLEGLVTAASTATTLGASIVVTENIDLSKADVVVEAVPALALVGSAEANGANYTFTFNRPVAKKSGFVEGTDVTTDGAGTISGVEIEGTKVTVILSEALASGKKVELIVGALVDAEYAANATTAAATYTAP